MFNDVHVQDVSDSENFKEIRSLISKALKIDLNNPEKQVSEALSFMSKESQLVDLRTDSKLMISLERELVSLFANSGINDFKSMQFPANIRILNSKFKPSESGNYRTTSLHCDSWSGAPQDTLNLFLGIFVQSHAPWLKMYKTFSRNHPAYSYLGPYDSAPVKLSDLSEVAVPKKSGTFVYWPTQTPHKTELRDDILEDEPHWRISIDVRLRRNSPYHNSVELNEENFSATKMNSIGVYWNYPDKPFDNINDKIEAELLSLKSTSELAYSARQNYLKKYYGE